MFEPDEKGRIMEKFIEKMLKIMKFISLIGGVCLFLDLAFVVVNIILRAFNAPVFGSTEIVRYGALVATAFALAYNQFDDGNIRVTLLIDSLSQKGRDVLGFIVECVLTCGFIYMTYYMLKYTISLQSKGDLTSEMRLPAWIFAGILFLGLLLMVLANVVKCMDRGYALHIKKDYEIVKKERFIRENGAESAS